MSLLHSRRSQERTPSPMMGIQMTSWRLTKGDPTFNARLSFGGWSIFRLNSLYLRHWFLWIDRLLRIIAVSIVSVVRGDCPVLGEISIDERWNYSRRPRLLFGVKLCIVNSWDNVILLLRDKSLLSESQSESLWSFCTSSIIRTTLTSVHMSTVQYRTSINRPKPLDRPIMETNRQEFEAAATKKRMIAECQNRGFKHISSIPMPTSESIKREEGDIFDSDGQGGKNFGTQHSKAKWVSS